MKKFTLLIALLVCAVGFSQTKSLSESKATTTFRSADPNAKKVEVKAVDLSLNLVNQIESATFDANSPRISSYPVNQRLAEFTLTHNTDNIITALNSVACGGGDNSNGRVFVLADFGVTEEFTISSGEIGVQSIGADMTVTVNVWDIDGGFPVGFPGTGVLLGTQSVSLPLGSDETIIDYTFDTPVVVPAGTGTVLVEVIQAADGVQFWIGGTAGETDDSWLASVTCGLAEYGTTTDIGFPDAHFYITVTGDTDGGGGGDVCADPMLEIEQNETNTCMAFVAEGVAQAFQPVETMSAGAGFHFESAPTAGTDLTLALYDALPPDGGVILASGTTVADGSAVWIDVLWEVTAVVPGNTYFLVVLGTADACMSGTTFDSYPGGDLYANAGYQIFPGWDYTFRTYSCAAAPA